MPKSIPKKKTNRKQKMTKIKTREEIHSLLKGVSNHQGICIRVDKIQTQDLKDFIKQFNVNYHIIVLLDLFEDL